MTYDNDDNTLPKWNLLLQAQTYKKSKMFHMYAHEGQGICTLYSQQEFLEYPTYPNKTK